MKKIKAIDLFCGCGGLSLGFLNAGFDIVAAFDNWKPAVDVYRMNFNHPIYEQDLGAIQAQRVIKNLAPDIIIGGPPCQDFSSAGHRNVNLGRAVLTTTYCDIITSVRPQYFLMENVPEITKKEILTDVLERFRDAGYGLSSTVLDASLCGVPQSRKRYVLVGSLGDQDDFLQKYVDSNLANEPMTMRQYFSEIGYDFGVDYYFRVPRSYNRRGVFCIDEPCQTIRGVDRPIPSGYKRHPADPVEIGPTVRALTVIERSYIQTFPSSFKFEGTKSNLNQMIGNAVPVKLAEYIARAIIEYDKTRLK